MLLMFLEIFTYSQLWQKWKSWDKSHWNLSLNTDVKRKNKRKRVFLVDFNQIDRLSNHQKIRIETKKEEDEEEKNKQNVPSGNKRWDRRQTKRVYNEPSDHWRDSRRNKLSVMEARWIDKLSEKEKKKEKKEQKPTVFRFSLLTFFSSKQAFYCNHMNFEWFLFSSDIMEVWD